jgi:hypothetical protein
MIGRVETFYRIAQFALVAVLLAALSGCNSGGVPLGFVSGHVTSAGKPKPGINVSFHPVDGGRGSQGSTDANGYYELTFAAGRKGAVLGQHDVVVEIKARFNDADIVVKQAQKYLTEQREVHSGSNTFDFQIDERQVAK